MNDLKIHKRIERLQKTKKAICPNCGKRCLTGKWGMTGPNPDTKIYVQKCPKCGELVNESTIVKRAIEADLKVFKWYHSVHHEQDAVELLKHLTGAQRRTIIRHLIRKGLYL